MPRASYRGPVVLNLPMDLQEDDFDWDYEYRPSTQFLPPRVETPSPDLLAPVIEKLIAAERPVIIAGRGATSREREGRNHQAGGSRRRAAGDVAAGQGLFRRPCVGYRHRRRLRLGAVRAVAGGRGLRARRGRRAWLLHDRRRLAVSLGGGRAHRHQADAGGDRRDSRACMCKAMRRKAVAAINEALEARQVRKEGLRTAATRAVLDAPRTGSRRRRMDSIRARWRGTLARRCRRVRCSPAAPAISSRGSACTRRCRRAWRSSTRYGFGAVGQGIGVAIGTGAGNPGRQHVAVEGDGSLMFNIQELETIVRHKMQMVLIVWNDAGYGAEVHKLVAKGFDEKLAQWESPDFVAIAKAFGGDGVLLKDPSELGAAVAEGLRKGGLYLIDARVSPTTPTDPYAKVHFGRESHAPLLRPVH